MKKISILFFLLIAAFSLQAQEINLNSKSEYIPCSHFGVTKPLSEIFANFDETQITYKREESEDREHRKPHKFLFGPQDGPQYGNDPGILQESKGTVPGKAPIMNWAGQTATGFRPMDPSGAVGPNHYVQMINSTTFRIYNKTGTVLTTGTLGNLWSPATVNNGDPIVMYDKAADRWFLAQFGTSTTKHIYIAVSTTNDPTGSYYTYTYTSPAFPDYLKFSVWHDGYYMTSNQAQKVFAFERSAMLAGVPTAKSIYISFSPPTGGGFFCPMPGDAGDGSLPISGPCPIFTYSDNGWGGTNIDAVNIYNMSVNWIPTTPTGSLTLGTAVPTAAFDAQYNSSWNDCVQPGTTQKLDGIGGIVMYRVQWKSWSGYNTVVLNWGVHINTSQRSIFWCELRQDQSSGVWSMYQQGIYTPDADTRWMGSIAMDNNGSIGIAYLKSNATSTYPGLYYTGRRSCDPLGTLPIVEELAAAGTGYQTGTNRVGDYSQTTLDPDGITFWHTGEYFGGTSGSSVAKTKIFSFQIPSCGNVANVSIAVTAGGNPACSGSPVTFTATPFDGGTTPSYQWKVNAANVGSNSPTYTTSSLTNGQVVTCVMTSSILGISNNPATSNGITMSITTPTAPTITISTPSTNICAGSSTTFTATPTNGGTTPAYQWKRNGTNVGTNSATYSSNVFANGDVITCVLTSNSTCATGTTATSNALTLTVTTNPVPSVSITASSTILCNIPSVTFTATPANGGAFPSYQWKLNGANVGSNSTTYTNASLAPNDVISCVLTASGTCPNKATLGTGTAYNVTSTSVGAFYPTYYGNARQQYLVRATELTGLGLSAGLIQSFAVNLNSSLGNPVTLNGYTIKLATTTATTLTTTFQTPTFTTVYGPNNYTPVPNALNTMNFTTPFNWNGTSNIIIDICFSNQVTGTASYGNLISTASFTSTAYYQIDGTGGAGACATATATSTSTSRPNIEFSIAPVSNATSNTITMVGGGTVLPSVNISSTSTSICSGTNVTFTATPTNGGTPTYQWMVNGANVGTNSAAHSSSTLTNGAVVTCTMTSSLVCANPTSITSNSITMNVTPSVTPTLSISGSPTTICAGTNVTFTANATNTGTTPIYQWKLNGTNVGTGGTTYNSSTLANNDIVSCVLTSNAVCATITTVTSNNITMSVSPIVIPGVSISESTNNICPGTNVVFTAVPTNGGAPVYAWKLNGNNVGTNSSTYSNNTLVNGSVITCIMTSSAVCASPSTATSNSLTMNVLSANPTLTITPSVNPTCAGTAVTFNANVSNGGTNLNYQWKINGNNVGSNSTSYSSSTLNNNDVVTCVLNSAFPCPTVSTLGTSTSVNTATSNNGAFFPTANGNGRQQYLIRASELTALGLAAGNIISLGVNVSSGTVGSPSTLNNYTIKLANTSNLSSASAFVNTGFTTVYGPQNYTPTVSSINTINFSTPFYWNGSSNIIVEICFSNQVTGATAYRNTYTTQTFTASTYYQVNGTTSTVCTQAAGTTTTRRPNFIFNIQPVATVTSNAVTMGIDPQLTPSINITASSTTICTGTLVNLNASVTNEGTSPSYLWKLNGNSVGNNASTYSSSSLNNNDVVTCQLTSNSPCVNSSLANSNSVNMTVNSCSSSVLVKVFIEGYYLGAGALNNALYNQGIDPNANSGICDDVVVELHDATNPYATAYTFNGTLLTNGNIVCTFPGASIGNSYYIVVKHRSSIQIWSANPVPITSNTSYDFTDAASKAYGNNLASLGSNIWAMYSGDINQDLTIDAVDYIELDADVMIGVFGYYDTDLNGDGTVDASDYIILDPNIQSGISATAP